MSPQVSMPTGFPEFVMSYGFGWFSVELLCTLSSPCFGECGPLGLQEGQRYSPGSLALHKSCPQRVQVLPIQNWAAQAMQCHCSSVLSYVN